MQDRGATQYQSLRSLYEFTYYIFFLRKVKTLCLVAKQYSQSCNTLYGLEIPHLFKKFGLHEPRDLFLPLI